MAKKKQMAKGLSFIVGLLGILAIVMLFLPAIAIKDTETTYSGFNAIFGYTEEGKIVSVEMFEYSFGNFLTFIFVIAGTALTILGLAGTRWKFFTFIIAALFIAAGIMFFLMVAFCVPNESISAFVDVFGGNIKDGLTLGIGAILGGVFSLLAGIIELGKLLFE